MSYGTDKNSASGVATRAINASVCARNRFSSGNVFDLDVPPRAAQDAQRLGQPACASSSFG